MVEKIERRQFAISRPVPKCHHCYRNGAGQVRRLVSVEDGQATFKVVKSGAGNNMAKRRSSYSPGYIGQMSLDSFRTWLISECTREGVYIFTPGLAPPRANSSRMLRDFADALKSHLNLRSCPNG